MVGATDLSARRIEAHHMQTIRVRTAARLLAGAAGAAVMGYAGYAAIAWLRYGSPPAPGREDADARLDRFMPVYDASNATALRSRRRPT